MKQKHGGEGPREIAADEGMRKVFLTPLELAGRWKIERCVWRSTT